MIDLSVQSNGSYDFAIKNELHPEVWSDEALRPDIRKALLKIAHEFLESLGIDAEFEDIQFTGSLANYNYTKYSDIDLHILMNFSEIDENEFLVYDYLMSKKNLWNNRHNITVKGHEVEIYPQDASEEHYSTGVYSVLNDEWVVNPSETRKKTPDINDQDVRKKADELSILIDKIPLSNNPLETILCLKDKIRKMRKAGLETGGEYSTENLVFKVLRRKGYLGKLEDARMREYDKQLSVNEE
tara:strand:+ start:1157 stop:1882 length:726 start_codon:yes stop_codon:yes gene_type:complete